MGINWFKRKKKIIEEPKKIDTFRVQYIMTVDEGLMKNKIKIKEFASVEKILDIINKNDWTKVRITCFDKIKADIIDGERKLVLNRILASSDPRPDRKIITIKEVGKMFINNEYTTQIFYGYDRIMIEHVEL